MLENMQSNKTHNINDLINKEELINKLKDIYQIDDTDHIPKGDMPGDKIEIGEEHIEKAKKILPKLVDILVPIINESKEQRLVISVCGGSGVGKSETASLLSYYLNKLNLGSYTLSGDNYPRRIPKYHDAERLRVYRTSGIRGLISHGKYIEERHETLMELQRNDQDANAQLVDTYPWLYDYQQAGKNGLKNYLGSLNEIDFNEINNIISQFKNGADSIYLKRMGREVSHLWYEDVDFSDKKILIIEWTHGNNDNLVGVDIPILLNSTPEETLEHRRKRNRDGGVDSPFTSVVLGIEQGMLVLQSAKAKIIISKNNNFISHDDYTKLMVGGLLK